MWYAARVRNNHEFAVSRQLEAIGIESYLPTFKSRNSRKKPILRPLISGYVFCRRVYDTSGMAGFVTFQGKPATIPDEEIDLLREVVSEETNYGAFKVGQHVEVVRGPFMGVRGILARIKGYSRLIMSPDEGRFVSFEISDSEVRAI